MEHVNGKWQNSTHTDSTPLNRSLKCVTGDNVCDPYNCAKFGANASTGGCCAHGWYITKFVVYLFTPFLGNSPVDGFLCLMAQMTRTLARKPGIPVLGFYPAQFLQLFRYNTSRVVSMLDSGAEGPGFKSQPQRCQITVSGRLFTPIVPLFTMQQNW